MKLDIYMNEWTLILVYISLYQFFFLSIRFLSYKKKKIKFQVKATMFNLRLHMPSFGLLFNLIYLLDLLTIILSFNIDVRHPIIHRSSSNSMFGYSIDFYQHEGMTL